MNLSKGKVFELICLGSTLIGIISLGVLLVYVFYDAIGWLDWQFITSSPSRFAEKAGVHPIILGSIYMTALVAIFALPLGVGAAIYLEEYASKNFWNKLIETNILNLAGVPSIVYGLLGLGIFVSALGMKHGTLLVAAFTMTLLILPIVIVSSQEAIRAVPDSLRNASYGIGSSKWQMIRTVVVPEAIPGIMTGTILSLARAMGEAAPIIMIGVATTIFTSPKGIFSPFGAMPLQIFAWSDFPQYDFQHGVVPAAIVVFLGILLSMNALAVFIRHKFSRRTAWS